MRRVRVSPRLVELAFVLLCTALLALATAAALASTTPAPLPPTAPPSPSPPEIVLDAGTIVDAASIPDSLLP
jgi:hypothetical protein